MRSYQVQVTPLNQKSRNKSQTATIANPINFSALLSGGGAVSLLSRAVFPTDDQSSIALSNRSLEGILRGQGELPDEYCTDKSGRTPLTGERRRRA